MPLRPGITSTPSKAAAPLPRSIVTPGSVGRRVTPVTIIESMYRLRSPLVVPSLVKTTSTRSPAFTATGRRNA
jgi:hypothetical protein